MIRLKKAFSGFLLFGSLSGVAWADLVLNLAVTGVFVAGAALGVGLVLAGVGAAYGLGIGLGFQVAGLAAVCAAGLVGPDYGWCNPANTPNMAAAGAGAISASLVPGGASASYIEGEVFPSTMSNIYAQDGSKEYLGYSMVCPAGATIGGTASYPGTTNLDCIALGSVTRDSGAGRTVDGGFSGSGDNLGGNTPGTWSTLPDGSKAFATDAPLSASVSADGNELKVTETKPAGDAVDLVCKNYPDKSMNCSVVANVPITDPQGNPATVQAVSTQSFDPAGVPVGAPAVMYSPTDSLGGSFDPNTSSLSPGSGGSGETVGAQGAAAAAVAGVGGTTGGTTGTGSCTTGDCATESTQVANKGILQGILDFFTGVAIAPGDPTARTGNEIKGVSLDGTGAFTGLKGWQLPAHASQCPTSSFAWNGNTYTFDAHCQLAADHFATFRGVMTLVFSLSALFVVLKA